MINLYKINKNLSLIIFFLSLISLTFLNFKNDSTQTNIIWTCVHAEALLRPLGHCSGGVVIISYRK
jgi:hypothetical protein